MSDESLTKARRRRLRVIAAGLGAILGLACHLLPADYHDACHALVKAVSLTCGGSA